MPSYCSVTSWFSNAEKTSGSNPKLWYIPIAVSRRSQAQVAEVNASSIISGSISYQSGDTVVVYVFKDSGSGVSMADRSSGGLEFWELYNDLGGLSVYVLFVDSVV